MVGSGPRALAACLAALLAAGGCHRADRASERAASSASPHESRAERNEASTNDKLNAYVDGYNALLSTFGLEAQYRLYAAQNLSQPVPPNRFVNVSVGWLDNALSDLRKAHDLHAGGLREVDTVGDRIVPDLDRLVGELKGLTIYYQSRGYLADDWARGRREDPQVIADFKRGFADKDALGQALEVAIARRDQAELDALKRAGDMVGYDGELAMQKSKALLHLFHGPQDLHDPAVFQKGDALVATIEGALADERVQLAKTPKGYSEHSMRNSGLTTAADRLETMVGHYRDLKQTGVAFNHQMMVAAYNDAVSNTNIMQ